MRKVTLHFNSFTSTKWVRDPYGLHFERLRNNEKSVNIYTATHFYIIGYNYYLSNKILKE